MASKEQQMIDALIEKVINNDECTRDFELQLTDFVNSLSDESVLTLLMSSEDINVRFVGVYGSFIYYRHMMEYDKLEFILHDNHDVFMQHQSLRHLRTIFLIDSDIYYSPEEISLHLEEAYDVVKQYNNMARHHPDKNLNIAGVQHSFADLFATYCERYESMHEELVDKWYKKALSAVDTAIQLSPKYAKYYCTRGRIISQVHNYEEALIDIQKSIRIEQPTGNKQSYSLRIMQYQSHKLNVQARFQIYKLNIQQTKINDDISKMKGTLMSNIEIIGFFAGIISFVIGSLTLANEQTAKDAASLILILLGAQLIVIDGFSFLLHTGKKNIIRQIIVLAIGILIVMGGICLVL